VSFDFHQLQAEMRPWQAHNFPGRSDWQPVMGMCEELGELIDAPDQAAMRDSVADCCIFMADACNALAFDMETLWVKRTQLSISVFDVAHHDISRYHAQLGLFSTVARFQHHFLKLHQGIRGSEAEHRHAMTLALRDLLADLELIARSMEVDLIPLVAETWAKVKQRDWQKDRNHGGQPEGA